MPQRVSCFLVCCALELYAQAQIWNAARARDTIGNDADINSATVACTINEHRQVPTEVATWRVQVYHFKPGS